jgi:hypothetical protein
MKTLILSFAFTVVSFTVFARYKFEFADKVNNPIIKPQSDSVKLKIDGEHAYYQNIIKVDSNIRESQIFTRALQFMASKNYQQNYGYQEEGKLIFTTTQDLNINLVYVGDDNDEVSQYTVQFAITIDMKNGSYRYTISNVIFFVPAENGNKRETLYEVFKKATNTESKRVAKDAKKLIESFERYTTTLTNDLYDGIEQKSLIYKSKF